MSRDHPLHIISALAPVLPLGLGLMFFRRLEKARRILLILMACSLIAQLIALDYFLDKKSNLFVYHFYLPIEVLLLGNIYKIWLRGYWKKALIETLIWSFVLFAILNTLFFQGLDQMNTHALFVAGSMLIIFAIAYFYRVLDEMKEEALEKSPAFWINTAVLLYYSGSLLILTMTRLLSAEAIKAYYHDIWFFHSCFNILMYGLFALGLWMKEKS